MKIEKDIKKYDLCRKYYVYIYLDITKPGSYFFQHRYGKGWMYQPFYVGKGCNKRMYVHLKETKQYFKYLLKKKGNFLKLQCIQKHFKNSINPCIVLVDNSLTEKEAFELEKNIISTFGRVDKHTGFLTNMTDGGEGGGGTRVQSNAEKLKRVKSFKKTIKDNPSILIERGKKQTLFNKTHPEKVKEKGRKVSQSLIKNGSVLGFNHPRYKKLDYVLLINEFFKFQSKKEILEKYNNIYNNTLGYTAFNKFLKILGFPTNCLRDATKKTEYCTFIKNHDKNYYIENYKTMEIEYYEKSRYSNGDFHE